MVKTIEVEACPETLQKLVAAEFPYLWSQDKSTLTVDINPENTESLLKFVHALGSGKFTIRCWRIAP
jgi:hypothetical protein